MTAYSCGVSTFPSCPVQPAGFGVVFATGTGFAPLSTVALSSSSQGALLSALADAQGQISLTYIDTHCTGQPDAITGTDAGGNTASVTFTCP